MKIHKILMPLLLIASASIHGMGENTLKPDGFTMEDSTSKFRAAAARLQSAQNSKNRKLDCLICATACGTALYALCCCPCIAVSAMREACCPTPNQGSSSNNR